MAIDFKSMDRRKLGLGVGSVIAGIIAVALTSSYIDNTIQEKAGMIGNKGQRQIAAMDQKMQILAKQNQDINKSLAELRKQAVMASQKPTQKAKEEEEPESPSIAFATPVGKRAVTFKIDRLAAIGGLLAPGDHVDIISHLDMPVNPYNPKEKELISVTLFQDVLVLAIDGKIEAKGKAAKKAKKPTSLDITVALDPQEAELITFAQKHGDLQLVLRSPLDNQAFILKAATWKILSEYILATEGRGPRTQTEQPIIIEDVSEPPPRIEVFRGARF